MSLLQRGLIYVKTADICNKYPSTSALLLWLKTTSSTTTSGSYFYSTKSSLNVQPLEKPAHIENNNHVPDHATKVIEILDKIFLFYFVNYSSISYNTSFYSNFCIFLLKNIKHSSITSNILKTSTLTDSFGRYHTYLRISLTERCNLRCKYFQ